MNRRGFLKLLSGVAASATLPVPTFVLASPDTIIPQFPIVLGKIREIMDYDLYRDENIFRLDAFNGKTQWHVDFRCHIDELNPEESRLNYTNSRKIAGQLLRDRLLNEGWKASDLILLPVYENLTVPQWLHA